jgi:pimeloyl-ACP methyl ester carboxylesterase
MRAYRTRMLCDMHAFVLLHAAWHGSWCWERVTPRLRELGHAVHSPDRPDLDDVLHEIDAETAPVVLVGHSSSGMLVSAAAERRPDHVALACYVSAFLLPDGVLPPDVARRDTESILGAHLVVDPVHRIRTVRDPEVVFYGECSPEDAAMAAARLTPEPLVPTGGSPTTLTAEGFGRVPKVYVVCEKDRALGPTTQRWMAERTPCRHVYGLPADHSPFLSTPDELTTCLHDAATRFAG